MLTRTILVTHLILGASCALFGQQKPADLPSAVLPAVQEFPVILEQNVVAGKTQVGTKIEAKLVVATLVGGTVIPRNAEFSGEVIESAAKTATDASRLEIRLDSVQWKAGSATTKVYLTSWYYPSTAEGGQSLQYGPTQPAKSTWNGQGEYPDSNSKVYRPFPGGGDSNQNSTVPDTPVSSTSNHRVLMKNVEATRKDDGAIALSSHHSNLKLDKYTTYVFAASDLLPAK